MKRIIYLIITLIIIFNCTGCNDYSKAEKKSENIPTKVNSFKESTDNKFSNNINDYYNEQDISQPLLINYLLASDYEELLVRIDSMKPLSSKQFELSYLEYWCDKVSFRKVSIEDYDYYYCVFENNDNEEKAFLFFNELKGYKTENGTYTCANYVTANGENIYENNSYGVMFYTHIADVDKR